MEKISSFPHSNNSVGKSGDNSSLSSSFILGSFLPLEAEGRDTSVDVSLLIGFPKKKVTSGVQQGTNSNYREQDRSEYC